jgi:ABC-type transport system involved in multi-copper enzyme maturation permease subunit
MDIISILLFFIYSIIILGILVYISPIVSAIVMIIVPVVFLLILSDYAVSFFSIMQFSYFGLQTYNLHILLFIWSAFIGVIAYAEVLTWYLLRGTETKPMIQQSPAAQGEKPKTPVSEVKDFFQKLYKILKGEKIKTKP